MAAKLPPSSPRRSAVAQPKSVRGKKRLATPATKAPGPQQGLPSEPSEPTPRTWVDRVPTAEDVAGFHTYRATLRAQQAPTPDAPSERAVKRRHIVATFLNDEAEPPKK